MITIRLFKQIQQAETSGNNKLKAELKQKLYSFTPCVIISNGWKLQKNITSFTGLLVLDFDHLDSPQQSIKLKQRIFDKPYIIAAWLSPSKHGVKALVSIPVSSTVDEFKEYFYGLATVMSKEKGFDPSPKDPTLFLFQSYDPNLLFRTNYTTWSAKGELVNDIPKTPTPKPQNLNPTNKHKQAIIKIIDTAYSNIIDNGHPQSRSISFVIGGYISAGYITESEAMQYIFYKIENHPYLKKGIIGYKKTATEMLRKGQRFPVYFDW